MFIYLSVSNIEKPTFSLDGENAIVYIQAQGDEKYYSKINLDIGEAKWAGVLGTIYQSSTFVGDPLKLFAHVENFNRIDAHRVEVKMKEVPQQITFIFQKPEIERGFSAYLNRLLARRVLTEAVMQHRVEKADSKSIYNYII